MKKLKIFIFILIVIAILGIIFFSIDYKRVKNGEKPLFCIKIGAYLDGGTVEYLGIGYKVINFNKMLPLSYLTETDTELKYYDETKIGTWFMKYEDFKSEYSINPNENDPKSQIEHTFNATIVEFNDLNMLVQGLEENDANHKGHFIFRIANIEKVEWQSTPITVWNLENGDKISITYKGEAKETYPAELSKIVKIELLDGTPNLEVE